MPQPTRAVERALDILYCFSSAEPSLTLTQIADRVGMHKSTVFRLLATLEQKRFVRRVEKLGEYRLGLALAELGFSVLKHNDIYRCAEPYLQHLAAESRENVDLAIRDGADVIYIQMIESQQRVKIAAVPGQRLPAYATASGKAFMAFLPEHELQDILNYPRPKITGSTQVTLSALRQDLRVSRERGFAISEGELEVGVNAVAAPVLDARQYPLAAIAVAGPSFRLGIDRLMELGKSLCVTTQAMARQVGVTIC